jgi:hypothetical protein
LLRGGSWGRDGAVKGTEGLFPDFFHRGFIVSLEGSHVLVVESHKFGILERVQFDPAAETPG